MARYFNVIQCHRVRELILHNFIALLFLYKTSIKFQTIYWKYIFIFLQNPGPKILLFLWLKFIMIMLIFQLYFHVKHTLPQYISVLILSSFMLKSIKILDRYFCFVLSIFVFRHFWRWSYENTKILRNLCLHFPRQDGQDRKNRKKITQLNWPKYQKPKDKNMGWTKQCKTFVQIVFW